MSHRKKMKKYNNYENGPLTDHQIKDQKRRQIRQARWDKRATRDLYQSYDNTYAIGGHKYGKQKHYKQTNYHCV